MHTRNSLVYVYLTHTCFSLYSYNSAASATSTMPRNKISCQRRHNIRILGRRYALTTTEHKYLEIGISVGPPSYIIIAIGDKRGNEIRFSLPAWKELMDHRAVIQRYLNTDDNINVNPLDIRAFTVKFTRYNQEKCICLETDRQLIMMASTVNRMFSLDKCIDHMFGWLSKCIKTVDSKCEEYSRLTYGMNNPEAITAAIEKSNCYDANELIDCELLALMF